MLCRVQDLRQSLGKQWVGTGFGGVEGDGSRHVVLQLLAAGMLMKPLNSLINVAAWSRAPKRRKVSSSSHVL